MPENARRNGCLDDIDVDFVEREATPRLLMKLGIQLHLTGLSLSSTVSIRDIFSVKRVRSTVHNWVHTADRQPEDGRRPDHVAVDETVIRRNDEQYWLYAVTRSLRLLVAPREHALVTAVDPETNELLHTTFEPTTTTVLAHSFLTELVEKHDVEKAVFLVDGAHSVQHACHRYGVDCRDEQYGHRNSVERVFRAVKRRTSSFSHCFSNASADTADEWLRSFAFAWKQRI